MVAIDLSPSSLDALDRGFEITACLNAQITLTHCIEIDFFSGIRELIGTKAKEHRQQSHRKQPWTNWNTCIEPSAQPRHICSHTRRLRLGIQCHQQTIWTVGYQSAGYGIQRKIKPSSLVLARLLLGYFAKVGALLIARNPCEGPYRTILIPVDFSHSSEMSIQLAKKIAPQSDVVLLHVFDMPYESKLESAGITSDEVSHYKSTCVSNIQRAK